MLGSTRRPCRKCGTPTALWLPVVDPPECPTCRYDLDLEGER